MMPPVTWLYVPGDRPGRFETAISSGADVVIIDLEDAVAPARKDEARHNALAFLGAQAANRRAAVHVRINDPGTERGRNDLWALADASRQASGIHLGAVRVPKVESPAALDPVDEAFGADPVPAYALLESAAGVVNAHAIAAHPRVAGLALGEQDLAAELSITDEAALDHLRLQVVVAAAAGGLPPAPMSVYPDLSDEAGLVASCVHGRALGMYGRTAIHPRQLAPIRQAFTPSAEEVDRAREIAEAADRAEAEGAGAIALPDGRFVDAPILARARRILALAEQLGTVRRAASQ